jgi:hypothetical protein
MTMPPAKRPTCWYCSAEITGIEETSRTTGSLSELLDIGVGFLVSGHVGLRAEMITAFAAKWEGQTALEAFGAGVLEARAAVHR